MANWKDNLIKIEPYVAGEQPAKKDFIKLNANENPYPPAPGVAEVIGNFNAGGLNKYPDANAMPLVRAIAARLGLKEENIFIGNGSDDVLPVSCRPPRLSSRCCRFPVPARQNTVSVPSCRHRAGRFLTPSAAFPACTSAVSFSRRPQDGKYKYLFRRNSPSGRHGLAGNLLFLHRFERLRRAGQHRFRAEGTRDRIQLKTFR